MQKNEETAVNSFKGYSLYNDVQDHQVRLHNRGAIMANILEEHSSAKKVSAKGLSLILGYFSALPPLDRRLVKESFENHLTQRGLANGT